MIYHFLSLGKRKEKLKVENTHNITFIFHIEDSRTMFTVPTFTFSKDKKPVPPNMICFLVVAMSPS
jgi:hypothetical protein